MDVQLKGTVEQVLEEQSGTGKNGPWRKQEFILKTEGDYPRQVCITQWGDNIDQFAVQEGEELVAHVDIQSREYQGRWYTDVKAWKIEKEIPNQAGSGPEPPFPQEEPDSGFEDLDEEAPF
ncbi:MAG: DUF3127 domain-containing protein [Balneolaceae bacterium]|nr:DUF3127 domain-containing protein [Balneolaceae bacterium]